jgi:hypothetical protein
MFFPDDAMELLFILDLGGVRVRRTSRIYSYSMTLGACGSQGASLKSQVFLTIFLPHFILR